MKLFSSLKHAMGFGSISEAVQHILVMKLSSGALLVLIPLFVFTFGPMPGQPHAEVIAYFAKPFPAIVASLTLIVGFKHFRDGVQVVLEDYVYGAARKYAILATTCLSYAAMIIGLIAIGKIAL